MPTARPIIVARIGVLEPMSMNAVIAVTPVRPRATPKMAVRIGSPAATSEPKVSTSTTSASPIPISSDAPPGGANSPMPWPLASTVSPESRASAMASLTASWVAGSTSVTVSTSRAKEMMPIRPSSESGAIAAAAPAAASSPAG